MRVDEVKGAKSGKVGDESGSQSESSSDGASSAYYSPASGVTEPIQIAGELTTRERNQTHREAIDRERMFQVRPPAKSHDDSSSSSSSAEDIMEYMQWDATPDPEIMQ